MLFCYSTLQQKWDKNVSAMVCLVRAQWRLAGWSCRHSGRSGTTWRTGSTGRLGWWWVTQEAFDQPARSQGITSNWNLTILSTNLQAPKTWCTWSLRQGSARGIPAWVSRVRTAGSATTPPSASTAATSCAAAEDIAPRRSRSSRGALVPSIGAAKWSANCAGQRKRYTPVYRLTPHPPYSILYR